MSHSTNGKMVSELVKENEISQQSALVTTTTFYNAAEEKTLTTTSTTNQQNQHTEAAAILATNPEAMNPEATNIEATNIENTTASTLTDKTPPTFEPTDAKPHPIVTEAKAILAAVGKINLPERAPAKKCKLRFRKGVVKG